MVQPSATPEVAVVVVTWNGAHLLGACLESLLTQSAPGFEVGVVVVDNGSTDGTDALLRDRFPQVRYIGLRHNTGFAAAANRGIEATSAPYVVLVNNDAVCAPDALAALLAPFGQPGAERLGAVTARILLADRYRLVAVSEPVNEAALMDSSGRRWVPVDGADPRGQVLVNSTGGEVTLSGNGRDRGWLAAADAPAPESDVFGFCGGGAALRRAALDDVGGFDEDLFLYYEDTDLSWRLRRRGWRIEYADKAVVWHQHAASSGVHSELFMRLNDRNRVVVAVRNAPSPVVVRAVAHTSGRMTRDVIRGRHVRRHLTTAAYLLKHLPGLLRQRRQLRRRATVDQAELRRYLVSD